MSDMYAVWTDMVVGCVRCGTDMVVGCHNIGVGHVARKNYGVVVIAMSLLSIVSCRE